MQNNPTYAKFYTPEQAEYLIALLLQHNISYKLVHEVNHIDKIYIGDSVDPMFALQIPQEHFTKVNELLAEQARADMQKEGFEHMFQSYDGRELLDVIRDSSWGAYDREVATILFEPMQQHMQARVDTPAPYQPLKLNVAWIAAGYLLALLSSFLFPLSIYLVPAAILGGLAVNQAVKTLPDGTRVKMYDKTSRNHGIAIAVITCILFYIGMRNFQSMH